MRAKVHVTQFNLFSDMDSLNPADNNTTKSTGLVQIPVMFFNHMIMIMIIRDLKWMFWVQIYFCIETE